MDSLLSRLREVVPDGMVSHELLMSVLKDQDTCVWNEDNVDLMTHTLGALPDPTSIEKFVEWLDTVAEHPSSTCKKFDAIAEEACKAVLEARPLWLDASEQDWHKYGGDMLEPALQVDAELGDSPVRLVDARFLIQLRRSGAKFFRRQDLPEAAFMSIEVIKQMPAAYDANKDEDLGLRLAAVSHPWQQPDHPDPRGFNLGILTTVLERLLKIFGGTFAVFFDFSSLFQKGPGNEARSKNEQTLFDGALLNMMDWYSHPYVFLLKLTQMPAGYPNGFDFQEDIHPNTAGYHERGWCFCESSASGLVKSSSLVLDLARYRPKTYHLQSRHIEKIYYNLWVECKAGRKPPLSPTKFRAALSDKQFTSRKADEGTVATVYERAFKARMGQAEKLKYNHLDWRADEMHALSQAICSVAMPSCRLVDLSHNKIDNEGMRCFSEALGKGALPSCQRLDLSFNRIRSEGMRWFSEALSEGALPICQELDLSENHIGIEGMRWLSEVLGKGALPSCQKLGLVENSIDLVEGERCFSEALGNAGRSLPELIWKD